MFDRLSKQGLFVIFFLIIIHLFSGNTFAQSCSNYYYSYTQNQGSCPLDKSCSNGCVNTPNIRNERCSIFGNACASVITGAHTYCTFGPNTIVDGRCIRTCDDSGTAADDGGVVGFPQCTACPYSAWSDIAGCGQNGCGPNDKQQRRTSSAGGSVCEDQYRCRTNTTFCVAPATPVVTTSSCSSPSNSSTAGWSAVSGATYYALRIHKTSVGWATQTVVIFAQTLPRLQRHIPLPVNLDKVMIGGYIPVIQITNVVLQSPQALHALPQPQLPQIPQPQPQLHPFPHTLR